MVSFISSGTIPSFRGEKMTDPKDPQIDPTSADDVLDEMEESPDTDSSANDPDEEEVDEEETEEEEEPVN